VNIAGTSSHESASVTAASTKCQMRSLPCACRKVASGWTIATRLSAAAMTTTPKITGPEGSSSIYREQICCAVSPRIQIHSNVRNELTPQSQATSTRVASDQPDGSDKNTATPRAAAIQTLG